MYRSRLRLLEGNNVQNEETGEWPNSSGGYLLKSDGFPISEEATRHAYEIFNAVTEEARSHYFTCNSDRHGPFNEVARCNRLCYIYFRKLVELIINNVN